MSETLRRLFLPRTLPVLSSFFVCLLLIAGTTFSPAGAQEIKPIQRDFSLGPVKIEPGFKLEQQYDDNLFTARSSSAKRDDFVTIYTPSLIPKLRLGNHMFEAGYKVDIKRYVDFTSENTENQTITGMMDLGFPRGTEVDLRVEYLDTDDPSSTEQETLTGPRTARSQFDVDLMARYPTGPRTKLEIRAATTRFRFDEATRANLERDTIGTGASWAFELYTKTSALVEYDFETVDFLVDAAPGGNEDTTSHEVKAGLRFDPERKLVGKITGGYQVVPFETLESRTGPLAEVELIWRPQERTEVDLKFETRLNAAFTAGTDRIRTTKAELKLEQGLLQRFFLELEGAWTQDDFSFSSVAGGGGRKDTAWTLKGKLGYLIGDFLLIGGGYDYTYRASEVGANEYVRNLAFLDFSLNLRP